LRSPISGWVIPLAEVPDPVFAGRVLGDGVAIDPFESTLRAPCDGVVTTLHRAHHAVTLRSTGGVEILMHIGLDTVSLRGEGFTAHVTEGQTVSTGDKLISFDMDLVSSRAPSLLVPVIVTNGDAFAITGRAGGQEVKAGDTLLEVTAAQGPDAKAAAPVAADAAESRRDVVVQSADGIHARPAGLVVQAARGFQSEISLQSKGRSVSARSAITIMGLGVQGGDTVTVVARGPDAEPAVQAVAALLVSNMGDAPGTTAPRAAPVPVPVPAAPAAPAGPAVFLPEYEPGHEVVLSGVSAAPGVAVGQAVRVVQQSFDLTEAGEGVAAEQARLAAALAAAETGLRNTLATAHDKESPAHAILSAHLAFLEDPSVRGEADTLVRAGKGAGFAWHQAMQKQVVALRQLGDPRMAERANDLLDVEKRVLAMLSGQLQDLPTVGQDSVLVADDLLPSQLAGLDASRIAGICTAAGGPTSHVAILAGSMGIPALVAVGHDVLRVPEGASVILDADAGALHVFPPAEAVERKRAAIGSLRTQAAADLLQAQQDCRTADGVRIEVFANIGSAADVEVAVANGAEGSGLLRSEFLFLHRDQAPTEDEQAAQYQAIATGLQGRPLIIRTMDAGADKELPYLNMPKEANPQLGVRGIRLGLGRPDLLRAQFRAILRVEPVGQCRIMLPMIASLAELRQARAMLDEERAALGRKDAVPLGIMIEVPSAAIMADALAPEADFFSVGTNDLTQYTLAMDRLNPALAKQVDALHPAVLRLIAGTVEAGRKRGRWVGVCGGLASAPMAAPLLVGLGITELSATAASVPQVKAAVRRVTMAACVKLARDALRQNSAEAVRALLKRA
jgi:phosphocarrier protein FPr/phosphocarrier protein